MDKHSLNQILYGPAGSGKTYATTKIALEILGINTDGLDAGQMKEKLQEYKQSGQVVFVSFHQSYGYEEFIEGIRPDFASGDIKYTIADGIFKKLCKKAREYYEKTLERSKVDFDELINLFAMHIQNEFLDKDKEFILKDDCTITKIIYQGDKKFRSFKLGGSVTSGQVLTLEIIKRDYENFKNDKIKSYKDVKPTYESERSFHGNANYYFLLYQKLADFEKDKFCEKFVIIIDEINRANVSKVFGELITLIEPSKRTGEEDEQEVILPYSGESFSVPKNLYIIGTMNSADRSVTPLDLALRRRFDFIKTMPDEKKVPEFARQFFINLNSQIKEKLGEEKMLGHAYLMDANDSKSLENAIEKRIRPLLEEYFYADSLQIDEILETARTSNDENANLTQI